jgi:acetolactate synthase-1/2/3 large subunit
VLFVGRGAAISGASREVTRLAEGLGAPCFTTPLAKGVMPEDHPLCLNWGGVRNGLVREFLQEADAILVIGSSLDEADGSRYGFGFEGKLIQVDADPAMIGRTYPAKVALVGDARTVLGQLLDELGTDGGTERPSPAGRIADRRAQALAEVQDQPMWQYMDAIERALPRDAFVANDGSRVNSWANSYLRRYQPDTYAVTRNTAALGFAYPAAIGAKIARPERESLAIVGDGGFLFTVFSLATAVHHRIGAHAVIFNDAGYGTISYIQNRQYGRAMGAALSNPDFVRLAECFGAHGCQAETPEQLHETLLAARARDLPTVIEVPLEGDVGFA